MGAHVCTVSHASWVTAVLLVVQLASSSATQQTACTPLRGQSALCSGGYANGQQVRGVPHDAVARQLLATQTDVQRRADRLDNVEQQRAQRPQLLDGYRYASDPAGTTAAGAKAQAAYQAGVRGTQMQAGQLNAQDPARLRGEVATSTQAKQGIRSTDISVLRQVAGGKPHLGPGDEWLAARAARAHAPQCDLFYSQPGMRRVAIVGNGPVSLADHRALSSHFDLVIRLGDLGAVHCHERMDIWVVRTPAEPSGGADVSGGWAEALMKCKRPTQRVFPASAIWFVGGAPADAEAALRNQPSVARSWVHFPLEPWQAAYGGAAHGYQPSDGWIALVATLECLPPGATIHMFGFTWTPSKTSSAVTSRPKSLDSSKPASWPADSTRSSSDAAERVPPGADMVAERAYALALQRAGSVRIHPTLCTALRDCALNSRDKFEVRWPDRRAESDTAGMVITGKSSTVEELLPRIERLAERMLGATVASTDTGPDELQQPAGMTEQKQ